MPLPPYPACAVFQLAQVRLRLAQAESEKDDLEVQLHEVREQLAAARARVVSQQRVPLGMQDAARQYAASKSYLSAPGSGGSTASSGGSSVNSLLTGASPLGAALVGGGTAGDQIVTPAAAGSKRGSSWMFR